MTVTINIDKKSITEKMGIWFLASQLLDEHKIENTGINQYHLYLWIKEYNKDCLEGDFICKASILSLPSGKKDVLSICRTKLKINKNNEQVLDNDFCLEFSFDKTIYHTTRTKICDENGKKAADLEVNDLDTELDIFLEDEYMTKWSYGTSFLTGNKNEKRDNIKKMSFKSYENNTADELFEKFKKNVNSYTKNGLRPDVYSLIDYFKKNTDINNEFTNTNIQIAALNHTETKITLEKIIDGLNEGIKYYKGDIEEFSKKIKEQEEEILKCENDSQRIRTTLVSIKNKDFCLWDKLHWYKDNIYHDWTPAYQTEEDRNAGLQIAINDVWGYEINISKFTICKKEFKYHLEVIFYDHFGLDPHDVKKFGELDDIFKIWYYLQHAKRFNGLYQPFITIWTYKDDIKGEL